MHEICAWHVVTIHDAEDAMVSELRVSREEARVYMLLLARGRMSSDRVASELKLDVDGVHNAIRKLVDDGACIEFGSEYEALNPRFAITNIYRMMCYASKTEVKRNIAVDQLATILEKTYEDARAKTK